jgi:hypothetical protein
MKKDLTTSDIHRRNVLNNSIVLKELYNEVSFPGIMFEGKFRYTKKQVADYFEVDERTIDRYVERFKSELEDQGYEVLVELRLRKFKNVKLDDIDVVESPELSISKNSPSLGLFTFKAFLNIGMLLTESEKARILRGLILDIVIDTLNKKLGGTTKYINQREEEFLPSAIREHNYRQEFTNALDFYVVESKFKYAQLTDKIYKSIFKEDANEYRQILKLSKKESVRSTLYSEILDLIASYENGFAESLKNEFNRLERKLNLSEANKLFDSFEKMSDALLTPMREKARSLMASRDMAFRDALHEKLKNYITHLTEDEFQKFLGEKSMELHERIDQNVEVFKRLKNR